jgi:hypothetical protein
MQMQQQQKLHSCSSTICFFFSDTKGTVPGLECALLLASLQDRESKHLLKAVAVVSFHTELNILNHTRVTLYIQYKWRFYP